MEEQDVISRIEELGLSNKEARVYVACLRLGPASVQAIADKAGIKRVTTYVILESLRTLGLARQSARAKKTFFTAEDPLNLDVMLRRKATEVSQQMQSLQLVLPQLASLSSVPIDLPEIRTYDGLDSVRSVIVDFFTTLSAEKASPVMYCNWERIGPILSDRLSADQVGKVICVSAKPLKASEVKQRALETRFVPAGIYSGGADIAVNADRLLLLSLEQSRPTAVLIRNRDFADTMSAWFELLWQQASPANGTY